MNEVALDETQRKRVEDSLSLVHALAAKLKSRFGGLVDHEELIGVGELALVRAATRYDPSTGASFAGYASFRVRGAMIDHLRATNRPGRQQRRAERALAATQDLLSKAQEEARPIAEHGTLRERLEAARELVERTTAVAISSRVLPIPDYRLTSDEPDPELALAERQLHERVRGVVGELPEKSRALVEWIYVEGRSMAEFAEHRGVSPSTISRQHARVLDELAKALRRQALRRQVRRREAPPG